MAYEKEGKRREDEPKLCLNKCGFYGSESTGNLCTSCYGNQQCLLQPNQRSPPPPPPPSTVEMQPATVEKKKKKRCTMCGKKLRILKEFTCRCNNTYCSAHRYPEDHCCGFDFKAAGRAQIEKNNPVVKPEKITKI